MRAARASAALASGLALACAATAAPPLPAAAPAPVVPSEVAVRVDDLERLPVEAREIRPGIFKIEGQGAIFLVNTPEGAVLVDTGFDNASSVRQKQVVDAIRTGPIRTIVLTHSHQDHSGGLRHYAKERAAGARVVAHERYRYMSRHQLEPVAYFKRRYKRLYPRLVNTDPNVDRSYWEVVPDRAVWPGQDYAFELGGVRFEVIAFENTGEGEDGVALWLPDQRVLFVGDLFGTLYPMFPNLYTVRGEKVRDPLDYIDACDRVLALRPEVLVPGHFEVVEGEAYVQASVAKMRDAVQYVWDATVAAMNDGKTVWQAMDEIELPPELRLSQGHGKVSWSVRAIWELLTGWYHDDSVANLYATPPDAVYADLVELAGGPDAIVARARAHADAGRLVEALRLLDVAAGDGARAPEASVVRVRIDVLEQLRARAVAGANNYSEVGLIDAELREARSALAD